MKILYLRENAENDNDITCRGVKDYFRVKDPNNIVLAPPINPFDVDNTVDMIKQIAIQESVDIVIGFSFGAFYALTLSDLIPKIVINPLLLPTEVLYDVIVVANLYYEFEKYENKNRSSSNIFAVCSTHSEKWSFSEYFDEKNSMSIEGGHHVLTQEQLHLALDTGLEKLDLKNNRIQMINKYLDSIYQGGRYADMTTYFFNEYNSIMQIRMDPSFSAFEPWRNEILRHEAAIKNIDKIAHDMFFGENITLLNGCMVFNHKLKQVSFESDPEGKDVEVYYPRPTLRRYRKWNVISIFPQGENTENVYESPLVAALKGKSGWSFKNKTRDLFLFLRQFIQVAHANFGMDLTYDTLMFEIYSYSPNMIEIILAKIFRCQTVFYPFWVIPPKLVYKNQIYINTSDEEKEKNLKKMIAAIPGKYFRFSFIPEEYRKYVRGDYSYVDNEETIKELVYQDKFNGKSVLIIDEHMQPGQYVSQNCKNIARLYDVKKLTFITLFDESNRK